jgi:hypothetical protein
MKVAALEPVDPPGTDEATRADPVGLTPDLVVTRHEDQAQGAPPGVVVQTAIRIGIDESVQIGVPPEEATHIVALQIGLAPFPVDEAAGQTPGEGFQKTLDHDFQVQSIRVDLILVGDGLKS